MENYLRYNGYKFTEYFDANSYLYVLKAMDIFDLSYGRNSLKDSLRLISPKTLFITFTSDFLFPPYQTEELVTLMKEVGHEPEWVNIESSYGHDAFLLEAETQTDIIKDFLAKV